MSGHSKWHNIQKTKGAQDAKRAAAFTKISKEMIVAVKEGGGIADPAYNSRLATVITKAKAANMPNDNIKRVLEKAAASGSGDNYETITYEGHGPCGVAVIVETMTDNRNRTAGSVRHHFDKYGGSLGTNGCVSWSFDRKGVIVIDNEDEELDEDTVMMDALDAGAADFQPEEGCFTVYTDPDSINDVAKALEDKGYKFDSAQIEMVPQTYQKLDSTAGLTLTRTRASLRPKPKKPFFASSNTSTTAWSAVTFSSAKAAATASSTLLPVFSTKAIFTNSYTLTRYLTAALFIIDCCAICIIFITTQYRTRPAGKVKLI